MILGIASLIALGISVWFHLDYMKALVYTVVIAEALRALYPRIYSILRKAERVRTYRRAIHTLRRTPFYGSEDH